jgi:hypothetical protein
MAQRITQPHNPHGAPTPLARPMPTEIRSDGGLDLQLLQAPYWAGPDGTPVIAEWRCSPSLKELVHLRTFLVMPDSETGIQPEAAIDAALKDLNIGAYLGTFVATGPNFNDVRMLFAIRPNQLITESALNRRIYHLMRDTTGKHRQAARDLRRLRRFWNESPVRSDGRLMMLSQLDLLGTLTDPEKSPFNASTLNP